LPPTMNPTILAIDGGGIRGAIPLEFLILVQESLGPGCKIQDLVDLAMGTSSGLWTLVFPQPPSSPTRYWFYLITL
jgi:patatin-like phospholipase/acyl hydrolase